MQQGPGQGFPFPQLMNMLAPIPVIASRLDAITKLLYVMASVQVMQAGASPAQEHNRLLQEVAKELRIGS